MISGEPSGDLHGSSLIGELKRIDPSVSIKGMGGPKMRAAGLCGLDSTPLSVVGVAEVFKKLPALFGAYAELKKMLVAEKFDCVVLIDYPDFNLNFAKYAKKKGVPVIYYISPQVWAWRRGRIKKIANMGVKQDHIYDVDNKENGEKFRPQPNTGFCILPGPLAEAQVPEQGNPKKRGEIVQNSRGCIFARNIRFGTYAASGHN